MLNWPTRGAFFACFMLTKTVEPRAAIASMSAQETVWGHASSSLALISSITSKPLTEFLFGSEFFSLTMVALLSNNTDASQPYPMKRGWKLHILLRVTVTKSNQVI